MRELFLILLICHILGDYYFQSEGLARAKDETRSSLLKHLGLYGIPFLAAWLIHRLDPAILLAGAAAFVVHGLIDLAKFLMIRRKRRVAADLRRSGHLYLADQALHWISLLVIARLFQSQGAQPWAFAQEIVLEFGLSWQRILQWTLALLLIHRPSNITFVKLFAMYKPLEEEGRLLSGPQASTAGSGKLRTGGLIGVLEKLLALMFLSVGEYMAIGLVLTAKSIARYDKISKSASFAEYYLIGTLTSIIMVLLVYVLCFHLLGAS